ncbi:MAG: DUF4358 domain-containing protein [Ruminiclostridium sp.]|nr:DUF4358 domain-containing protein [Ruminiclostridium sp.]
MKKKIICAALLTALVCGAESCGNNSTPAKTTTAAPAATTAAVTEAAKSDAKAADVTKAILDEITINSAFEKSKESLEDYFDGLDISTISDSSYYICASGAYPDEIAVFKFDSADSAKNAVAAVNDRLDYQKTTYKDYTPEEYYKLEDAVVEQSGEWLYYLVTSDNTKAKEIVNGFIG